MFFLYRIASANFTHDRGKPRPRVARHVRTVAGPACFLTQLPKSHFEGSMTKYEKVESLFGEHNTLLGEHNTLLGKHNTPLQIAESSRSRLAVARGSMGDDHPAYDRMRATKAASTIAA